VECAKAKSATHPTIAVVNLYMLIPLSNYCDGLTAPTLSRFQNEKPGELETPGFRGVEELLRGSALGRGGG
jgi:hypothetical protein